MNHFVFDPMQYGIADREQLKDLRIWDTHYHGFLNDEDPISYNEKMMKFVSRMGVERVIALDVGGTRKAPFASSPFDKEKRSYLQRNSANFSGIIRIDPSYPEKSMRKMEAWIEKGPCIGIKYAGFNDKGITCDHPNNNDIVQKAMSLSAIIYIHTWIKTGGSPRIPGGGNYSGESTPWHVVNLAKRFPDTVFICGHAGGDWELGVRAIRECENVFLEFCGSDPHSGSVDLAVNELGADRIVWGGHGPSRSYSTELAKVLDASISHDNRTKILGGNYRDLARSIFKKKGLAIDP